MFHRLLLGSLLTLIFWNGFASEPDKLRELVVQVPNLDEFTVSRIHEGLSKMKGVRWYGYCQDDSCLLIKYDAFSRNAGSIIRSIETIAQIPENVVEITDYTFLDLLDGQFCNERESVAVDKAD